jgi:isoleucyl-tRNA synthetase
MSRKFAEYKGLNLSQVNKDVLEDWKKNDTFRKSLAIREGHPEFIFYEGPPSANGMPGIHHVMARSIKDIFCRYKTMKGFKVERKAGWDTHGLPVELGVEKSLGITKEDIGKTISVAEYNATCRKDVMKYTDVWQDLTEKMGYWVDMNNPYITYDNRYIETLWYLLKELYNKGLLYKGYTIQPYSPAAGTGLSSHELNQPGCYRDVKDTTCIAQFKTTGLQVDGEKWGDTYFIAWTTTPWTLPSNTALCVGSNITYVAVKTYNPYTGEACTLVLAKDLVNRYFSEKAAALALSDYKAGDKLIPFQIVAEYKGKDLEGIAYEQLIPWVNPGEGAFRVITGDFVTTEDGTGIVHIAPTFGADDARVAKAAGVPPLQIVDKAGNRQPMVDRTGKFFTLEDIDNQFTDEFINTDLYQEFAGRYVKNDYDDKFEENDTSLDVDICVMLKQQGKAFKIEKHTHSYPHCWRTDKPVLYYPLDSWFIRATAVRDKMIELNNTINWKPQSTGAGRFGKWLENLQDWNLSRSRYWGTPLPIWRTEDGSEEICIGSVAELKAEIEKSLAAGVAKENPLAKFEANNYTTENYSLFDLHRPYVDDIVLVSKSGKPMYRESDLIDVWFDSGAMPYAQAHYPFETGGSPTPTLPKGEGAESASLKPKYQTARASIYPLLKELAEEKRKNQTQAEAALWEQLRGKNIDGLKFRRQHVIDEFIVDFVCLSKALIIEVDGGIHLRPEVAEADKTREEILKELGYTILRFSNNEVLQNTDKVLQKISEKAQLMKTVTTQNSLPDGEGRGGAFSFPADFIAEGVDQTRGWFYTLHAISTMVKGSVAFKNVMSNGLVLDKNGNKMSKRLGNAVDPFTTIEKYGSDAVRWYMISNSQPWDNLKFDMAGVDETVRKFFGTLYNTYSFFSLYANIDGFCFAEKEIPVSERPEIDRWIISLLNSLIKEVDEALNDYEPTRAARAINDFVGENLSNWYVRLNRKRFWGGEYNKDKISAYQTLYTCIETVARLMSPIAPFFADRLFTDLNAATNKDQSESVHLSDFPEYDNTLIDSELEYRMDMAQRISSLVLSLRRKVNIKVRQPLQKIMVPVLDESFRTRLEPVKNLILTEVNVKELEYLTDTKGVLVKKIKPNFKTIGPKYGKLMKAISAWFAALDQDGIYNYESQNGAKIQLEGQEVVLELEDAEIASEDIPGWLVAGEGKLTVALDITISEALRAEGLARELVNRIQNIRKESGFDVTDKIEIRIKSNNAIDDAVEEFADYIGQQTLGKVIIVEQLDNLQATEVELDDEVKTFISLSR